MKNKIINKKRIILVVFIIFIIGLIFGSIYISVVNNDNKKEIIESVNNYFYSFKNISFSDKISIFKDTFIKNILYIFVIWLLGISIIGIPIILCMIFYKAFIIGFSISSIFGTYKFKSILVIIFYMFPSNIILILYTLFLSAYSINISIKIINNALKKKSLNFSSFMGKYFFLLLIGIIISFLTALFNSFVTPYLYKLFTNIIK